MSATAQKKYTYKFKQPIKPLKPHITHVPNEQWKEEKYRLFKWAENEVAKKGYSGNIHNLLKEIINCSDAKGITHATLETLHNRLISRYGKAAPSRRTIDNYIAKLVAGKTIKRGTQKTARGLIKTRLLTTKLASGSTQQLRTEYISHKRYIYTGEGDTKKIAAFPSTMSKNIGKSSCKAASAAALMAAPLAAPDAPPKQDTPEELAIKRARLEEIKKQLRLGVKI